MRVRVCVCVRTHTHTHTHTTCRDQLRRGSRKERHREGENGSEQLSGKLSQASSFNLSLRECETREARPPGKGRSLGGGLEACPEVFGLEAVSLVLGWGWGWGGEPEGRAGSQVQLSRGLGHAHPLTLVHSPTCAM